MCQKRVVYLPTNSFYQVLLAEAYSKHGFNIHGVVFDELHTQPNRKLFDVMTKGSGDARMQPLYFLITTAGTNRRDHREQGRRVWIHDAGKHDGLGERERPRHLHPHRDSQRDGLREDGLGSPQGFSRHQNQFQHLLDGRTPQAGGTFESRRRDRARCEIHRRNQRHGAFLHRNLLSRKKGAPLGKAVLMLIT